MIAHRIVHAHELRIVGEDRRRYVVYLAADKPAHRHVELEVHDVEFGAVEVWIAGDVILRRTRPCRQKTRHQRFARGFLLGVRHAYGWSHNAAQVFHM